MSYENHARYAGRMQGSSATMTETMLRENGEEEEEEEEWVRGGGRGALGRERGGAR